MPLVSSWDFGDKPSASLAGSGQRNSYAARHNTPYLHQTIIGSCLFYAFGESLPDRSLKNELTQWGFGGEPSAFSARLTPLDPPFPQPFGP